jgi:UTP--glucose-1-phosphate uridylyltransferase
MKRKMRKIRKAVFPVANFVTHFLPAIKAMPKAVLLIIDKPLIQYAAEEVIASGIDTLVFVTGRNKRTIEDYFDANYKLESLFLGRVEMIKLTWFECRIGW